MTKKPVGQGEHIHKILDQEIEEARREALAETDPAELEGYDTPLNDEQERYCQLRADGFTKTRASKVAYPNGKFPGQYGHIIEKKLKIRERILELKQERIEVSDAISLEEQIRTYQDMYQMCVSTGKLALALKALERLDMLAGYDIKRSESLKKTQDLNKPLDNGDELDSAIKRFSTILGTHGERPKHQKPPETDPPKKH